MASKADQEIIKEAMERWQEALDFEADQRIRMRDDIRFAAGDQWDDRVRRLRENDPDGARPCLTMDKIGQYRRQVINDARQNKPSVKVRPVDDVADPEVAEILQGVVRHIEDVSNADVAYDLAIDNSTGPGVGYIRITTKVVNEARNEQEIRIDPVHDIFTVLLDPDRRLPDGSDSMFGFVTADMPRSKFEREYPSADVKSWESDDIHPDWVSRSMVKVAEYYRVVDASTNVLRLADGQEMAEADYWNLYQADEMRPPVVETITKTQRKVEWYKLTCGDILDRTEIPCEWIPIVECIGNEHWVNGKRMLTGMTFWGADAQRAYNYARSAFVEQIALAPKAPYIAAAGQIEDYEEEWRSANVSNAAVLTYNPVDVNGSPVPPPQRQMPPQPSPGWSAEMQQSEHDIQSALGMYNANLGQEGQEKSGRAIMARQKEGDTSTFHYVDNLSRSIRQVGRILIQMIPRIYDTQRVIRIIGEDGEQDHATIAPQMPRAFAKVKTEAGEVKRIFNPTIGTYDVSITVGPSYSTKRMESADAMVEMVRGNPQLMGIVGDLMVRAMDWPDSDKIADRLKLMLPPQIQQAEQGGDVSPEVAQAVQATKQEYEQKIAQMIQQVQAMQQQLQQISAEKQQLEQVVKGKVIEAQIKQQELQARAYEIQATNEVKAQELALKAQDVEARKAEAERQQFEAMVAAQREAMCKEEDAQHEAQEQQALQAIGQGLAMLMQQVAELQQRIADEENEPPERKEIVITSPSGGVYRGVVVDGSAQIVAPSGAVFNGTIQ